MPCPGFCYDYVYAHDGTWLFNITADPEEKSDLSLEHPDKVAELMSRLEEYNRLQSLYFTRHLIHKLIQHYMITLGYHGRLNCTTVVMLFLSFMVMHGYHGQVRGMGEHIKTGFLLL
jgi:hypothetical protein